jgi:hypothetical protein
MRDPQRQRSANSVSSMMRNSEFDYLLLLPSGLGVAFMVWVFWNLGKQIKR